MGSVDKLPGPWIFWQSGQILAKAVFRLKFYVNWGFIKEWIVGFYHVFGIKFFDSSTKDL